MSEGFPPVPDIVGGLVEGVGISNILYGISIAQAYVYTQNWGRDPMWMKCLAVAVILLETVHTVFVQRMQYFYSVLAITDPVGIIKIDWSVSAALLFDITPEIVSQAFYVYRMWVFSRNLLLTCGTVFLLMCRYGFYLICIIDTIRYKDWLTLKTSKLFKPAFFSTWSIIMFTDAIIAITMAVYLHRKQPRIRKTRGIMTWMILYFVNTGAVLVAISITGIVTYLVSPNTLLFTSMVLVYNRALSNALLGSLNARALLRTKQSETVTFGGTSLSDNTAATSHELHKVQVRVDQDILKIRDTNSVAGTETAFKSTHSVASTQAKV